MTITPPPGSRIRIEANDTGEQTIVVPVPLNVLRILTGIFAVGLIAWVFGERHGISLVLSGMTSVFAFAFQVLWLTGWTLAGVLLVYLLYRTLRLTVPETLQLKGSGVAYDAGDTIFSERNRCAISSQQMQSLRLRRRDAQDGRQTSVVTGGRCLTVDVESGQIVIAAFVTDSETEWLARLLADRYGVPYEHVGC